MINLQYRSVFRWLLFWFGVELNWTELNGSFRLLLIRYFCKVSFKLKKALKYKPNIYSGGTLSGGTCSMWLIAECTGPRIRSGHCCSCNEVEAVLGFLVTWHWELWESHIFSTLKKKHKPLESIKTNKRPQDLCENKDGAHWGQSH